MTSVLQRARQVITRPFTPGPPFTDELDDVIVALTLAREASIDFVETCAPAGAAAPAVTIAMPGESLDALIVNLEVARLHRNQFWSYRTRWFSAWIWILVLNLVNLTVLLCRMAGWLP